MVLVEEVCEVECLCEMDEIKIYFFINVLYELCMLFILIISLLEEVFKKLK